MIVRFRPANIRLIHRRQNLPRLLLALSSNHGKSNNNDKNNPTISQELTGSLHIRTNAELLQVKRGVIPIEGRRGDRSRGTCFFSVYYNNSGFAIVCEI
jgi:hypothetical protein